LGSVESVDAGRVNADVGGYGKRRGTRSRALFPSTQEVTMPRKKPGPSIKDDELYEKLRDEGNSKQKSARIANAAAATSRSAVGRKGGESGSYEDWTKADLVKRARELGIEGRSSMDKSQLVDALRNH
jgi:hypothetical protein